MKNLQKNYETTCRTKVVLSVACFFTGFSYDFLGRSILIFQHFGKFLGGFWEVLGKFLGGFWDMFGRFCGEFWEVFWTVFFKFLEGKHIHPGSTIRNR